MNRLPHIVVLFFLCFAGCESKPAVKQNTVTESKTAVALVAVDKKRENARPEQKPDAGLQKIITDVANDSKINGSSMKKVEAWLDKNLKKGVTTRNDFVQRFGKMNLVDLDRPPRDNVITLVWFIYNDGPPKQLGVNHYGIVFWFDAKTGKFLRRYQTWSICGYCPHIFANDGRWRLEGKLLAGCVGRDRKGTDSLILPRLSNQSGKLGISIRNLATEVEYIDQVRLGTVFLKDDEELDVAFDGTPTIWKPIREINYSWREENAVEQRTTVNFKSSLKSRVLVLAASISWRISSPRVKEKWTRSVYQIAQEGQKNGGLPCLEEGGLL